MRSWRWSWRSFVSCLFVLFILHLLYVLELHQNPVVEGPTKEKKIKFDHLVLGPAAGQGLHNRLQCQGTKALNKTHLPSSSRASNAGDSVAFVTVFTVYNSTLDNQADTRSSNMVTVGNTSYSKTERSMAILNVFINFIQVTMPRSNVIILTDPTSDLSLRRSSVTVYPIQGDYSRDQLMLQRIRSYINFLEIKLEELAQNPGHSTNYIFTDSDIAVVDDLGHMFNNHPKFDLALTFRNNKQQPLNSGFIAVRGATDAVLRAKVFLQEVLKVYSSKFMNASGMLGDQLALAFVVKSHPGFDFRKFTKAQAFIENIAGTSVLFLPCATYNWTPPEGAGQFHGMPLDVKPEKVRRVVNLWAENETRGLIEELRSPGSLSAHVVVANALYFKGQWRRQFDTSWTRHEDFHLLSGRTMRDRGLRQLTQKFNSNSTLLNDKLMLPQVELSKVWIPKFKFSYAFTASDTMKTLGLTLPFLPTGDFSELVDFPFADKVCVSIIVHKSCIEVKEKGTEAAACTATVMIGCANPMSWPPERASFIAGHPFTFMIKEELSGTVFFTGPVLHPLKGN